MPAKKGKKAKNNIVDSLPKKIRDKIYDLRENQNKSYLKIAKETGCTEHSIGNYCRKYITPFMTHERKEEYQSNHMIDNTYTANRKVNSKYTPVQIAEIIEKLLEWVYNSDEIYMAGFIYKEFKRSKSWLYELADHHPEMKDALETTRQLIAQKIGNHSFLGDRNSTFGEKILPMYCPNYKALVKWKAELAKQSQTETSLTAADLIKAAQAGKLLDLLTQKD